jgi:hypothetical protein
MVAHAELVPSGVSPLHIWLIDSGSSNLYVVSSISGCGVRTSNIRMSLRSLSCISGAKSGRECIVHLLFGGVPLDVRVLEVPSCQINILSHSVLEAAIGTQCQLNYIKTSTQHALRITHPDRLSVVLPVSPDGLVRVAVSTDGSILPYVEPARSKAVYTVSAGAGLSWTLPEAPIDWVYEGQCEWGAEGMAPQDMDAIQRITLAQQMTA